MYLSVSGVSIVTFLAVFGTIFLVVCFYHYNKQTKSCLKFFPCIIINKPRVLPIFPVTWVCNEKSLYPSLVCKGSKQTMSTSAMLLVNDIYGSIRSILHMSPPSQTKIKVVFFLHFLAETPSHGYIFYEKLVWPPKILTTWTIFCVIPQKSEKTW